MAARGFLHYLRIAFYKCKMRIYITGPQPYYYVKLLKYTNKKNFGNFAPKPQARGAAPVKLPRSWNHGFGLGVQYFRLHKTQHRQRVVVKSQVHVS